MSSKVIGLQASDSQQSDDHKGLPPGKGITPMTGARFLTSSYKYDGRVLLKLWEIVQRPHSSAILPRSSALQEDCQEGLGTHCSIRVEASNTGANDEAASSCRIAANHMDST